MTVMAKSEVASDPNEMAPLRGAFLQTVYLVERAHHQMLEVIKDELDRRNELGINGVQAMLIFEIGDRVITAAQLYKRGHYQAANISHNLKKLTAAGYVSQGRSQTDRRSIPVQLTKKGEKVTEMLDALFNRHLSSLAAVINVGDRELGVTNAILDASNAGEANRKQDGHGDQAFSERLMSIALAPSLSGRHRTVPTKPRRRHSKMTMTRRNYLE